MANINTKSIRARFLALLTLTAVTITAVSVIYDLFAGGAAIREQIVKRGRYVASNLAFNAKYGVLTEDKPLLAQFLAGAVASGGEGQRSDHHRGDGLCHGWNDGVRMDSRYSRPGLQPHRHQPCPSSNRCLCPAVQQPV